MRKIIWASWISKGRQSTASSSRNRVEQNFFYGVDIFSNWSREVNNPSEVKKFSLESIQVSKHLEKSLEMIIKNYETEATVIRGWVSATEESRTKTQSLYQRWIEII